MVIEIADESGNGPLEVHVVFPKGVVGIDEESLAGRELGHEVMVALERADDRDWEAG